MALGRLFMLLAACMAGTSRVSAQQLRASGRASPELPELPPAALPEEAEVDAAQNSGDEDDTDAIEKAPVETPQTEVTEAEDDDAAAEKKVAAKEQQEGDDNAFETAPAKTETKKTVELPPRPPMPKPKTVAKLNPIVIKGNFLYDSVTGKRFFAKGTSYNPRSSVFNEQGRSKGSGCEAGDAEKTSYTEDIIADTFEERWSEDLEAIANLGANTVRLFNVDAGKDHSKFMEKAASLGIYVIIPLNSKDYGFLPAFPSPKCYTEEMTFEVADADGNMHPYGNVGVNVLSYGKQIVKQFSKYDNTLFFTVNNEFAMNDKEGFAGFQCVKALTRDIHEYQRSCDGMRRVPLIYSDYDMGHPDRKYIADYLTCAVDSPDDAIDAYGLNVYSYCEKEYPDADDVDSFDYSPYYTIKKDFKDLSVPMLFTEFGCVEGEFVSFCPYKGGRTWPDVKWFFNKELGEILSGAIAYTYEQDYEERGMVLTPGFLKGQNELYLLDSYFALQEQFKKYNVSDAWDATPANIADDDWTPERLGKRQFKHSRPKCPSDKTGHKLMKKRGTSEITDWSELPPSAIAPLAAVGGQAECPAGSTQVEPEHPARSAAPAAAVSSSAEKAQDVTEGPSLMLQEASDPSAAPRAAVSASIVALFMLVLCGHAAP